MTCDRCKWREPCWKYGFFTPVCHVGNKETTMDEQEQTEGKRKAGAKLCSRVAMVFSSAWIATLTICKGAGLVALDVDEIIISGAAIVGIWCPTFLSVYLDKIKAIREAGKK